MPVKSPEAIAKKMAYQRQYHHRHRERRNRYIHQWSERNVEYRHLYHRERKLKQKYGMTIEQFDALLRKQNGRCAICGVVLGPLVHHGSVHGNTPVIDHKGHIVRGILCSHCNVGIGMLKDDITILIEAILYLERFQ